MPFDLPSITLVISAGAAAFLSPCGYAMFPGYITYYLGLKDTLTGSRAFLGGLACTLGLITIFIAIGTVLTMLGSLIYPYIPYLGIPAGVFVIILGVIMIANVKLNIRSIPLVAIQRRGILGLYTYGLLYGLAIISCTAPIFLAIVLMALSSGGLVEGFLIFLVYALGMAVPLLVTTMLVYKAKEYAIRRIMQFTRWVNLAGGIILILIGVYMIFFSLRAY